jgi:class 3 adenylate cyclase
VDEVELYRRLYARARGRGIRDDIGVMERAIGERATVLFLDLRDSTKFVTREDPAVVRLTLNQLFAAITEALEPHRVTINQYLGDGFMALSREGDHARNAVASALDVLRALERFNRPRRALGLKVLEARIGISTGPVVLGNIGTHHKVDFTAVGPTTNEAARRQGKARPGLVCVSESTFRAVGEQSEYDDPAGREVELAGVDGPVRVWDVKGRTGSQSAFQDHVAS